MSDLRKRATIAYINAKLDGNEHPMDAALTVALEEAARVAEGNGLRQYTGKPLIDEIAAAIRALIPTGRTPS